MASIAAKLLTGAAGKKVYEKSGVKKIVHIAAAGLLVIPTAILAKKSGDYWKRRAGMKDQDVIEWDQEAANVIEVGSYPYLFTVEEFVIN